jgi:hypothetical protein
MALRDKKVTANPHTPTSTSIPSPIIILKINKSTIHSEHRARALCEEDSLQAELVFLSRVFIQDGYNNWQIHRALNRHPHVGQLENKPNSVAAAPSLWPFVPSGSFMRFKPFQYTSILLKVVSVPTSTSPQLLSW